MENLLKMEVLKVQTDATGASDMPTLHDIPFKTPTMCLLPQQQCPHPRHVN